MWCVSTKITWQKAENNNKKDTKDVDKEREKKELLYFVSIVLCVMCVWIPRWVKRIVIDKCVKKETDIPHTNYSAHESPRL